MCPTMGGCKSWYLDANGRNTTLWPTFTWPFREKLRRFDALAYEFLPRPAPVPSRNGTPPVRVAA